MVVASWLFYIHKCMIHHFNQWISADAKMYHTFVYVEHTWSYGHFCTQIWRSVSTFGHGNRILDKLPRPTRVRIRPEPRNLLLGRPYLWNQPQRLIDEIHTKCSWNLRTAYLFRYHVQFTALFIYRYNFWKMYQKKKSLESFPSNHFAFGGCWHPWWKFLALSAFSCHFALFC